jgi:hypothetical protein
MSKRKKQNKRLRRWLGNKLFALAKLVYPNKEDK